MTVSNATLADLLRFAISEDADVLITPDPDVLQTSPGPRHLLVLSAPAVLKTGLALPPQPLDESGKG